MPPRSISSYFKPLPTSVSSGSASFSKPPPSVAPAQSSSPLSSLTSNHGAADESSPSSAIGGANGNGGQRSSPTSKLSAAAKRAIQEGIAEARAASSNNSPGVGEGVKRAKLGDKATATPLSPIPSTIKIPQASSRAELRALIEAHPNIFPLLELELETLGEDWLLALQGELVKPYFLTLKQFVLTEQKSKKIFPPAPDVYSWSRLCPLENVRVVIVGQDPYHDDGQAHGLAFSVRRGVRIPPSLRNIYKEMSQSVPGFVVPPHGDLTEWAKHGVLLLNTSLTVRAHEAASHSNRGWEQFTSAVLKVITSRLEPSRAFQGDQEIRPNGVVFMVWGAHAAKMIAGTDAKKHLILRSAHPSPLSASRGFFGNGHFKKSNEWLVERYGANGGIDWKGLGATS